MANSKPVAVAKWANGGDVARVVKYERGVIGWQKVDPPFEKDGEKYGWTAFEGLRDMAAGSIRYERGVYTKTEAEAKAACLSYAREDEQKAREFKQAIKADEKRKAELLTKNRTLKTITTRDDNSEPVTESDLGDYEKAIDDTLRAAYPKVFACMDRIAKGKAADAKELLGQAYLLDIAAQTGKLADEATINSMEFVQALAKAASNHKRSGKKSLESIALRREILRGWWSEPGYAFLSHEQRAEAISKAIGASFPKERIRKLIEAMGIVAKRKSGREITPL